MKSLSQILQRIIRERAFEVEGEILARDPEFREVDEKIQKLVERLRERLPDEERELLMELDEEYHQAAAVAQGVMYRAGFRDGMKVKRVLRGVGTAEYK